MPKPRNPGHPSEQPRLKAYVSTWLSSAGISGPLRTAFLTDSEGGLCGQPNTAFKMEHHTPARNSKQSSTANR